MCQVPMCFTFTLLSFSTKSMKRRLSLPISQIKKLRLRERNNLLKEVAGLGFVLSSECCILNHKIRVLKLECASETSGGLVKIQISGSFLQSF